SLRVHSISTHDSCTVAIVVAGSQPSISSLFPYTTLFRSIRIVETRHLARRPARHGKQPSGEGLAELGGEGRYIRDQGSQAIRPRSEEHTSELQSRVDLVCRLLLEKKKIINSAQTKAVNRV